MTQSRQWVRSTKPKAVDTPPSKTSEKDPETLIASCTWSKHTVCEIEEEVLPPTRTSELHVWDELISKLYTNDCGRFPIRYCSGKISIMIAYNCDRNTVIQATLASGNDKHRIPAYNSIMKRLADWGRKVDMQVLDN